MTQIFKTNFEKKILINFLNDSCIKHKNYYIFNTYCFKKALLENKITSFLVAIKGYYHKSKMFYVERDTTYANFSTIIRQICKHLFLPFTSKLIYYNSTYEIKYFIFPMIKE